ncbi:MAG TPA: HDIG domain-containing protein [Coprothermobacter sp.]|nr:HDIG domain-containing protein [Coprothermobacter sp.]
MVLILFVLGVVILFVGLLPLRAPIKDGRFTRSVVTDRNLSIRYGQEIQGTLLVSDEMTVKSYVNALSKLGEQTADSELRQALASLSQYVKAKGIYETEIPISANWLQNTLSLSAETSQKLVKLVSGILVKPTWVERPLDVITAITTAENVVIPAGTLVARDGDEVLEEQVRALMLMGLWIPGKAFYPVKYWMFILLVPAVWLLVTWRSQVYKSYSPVFYFFYGVVGALVFFYVYRFSSLLLGLPLFLFAFLVLSSKMAEKGLWSMLVPMCVLSLLAVPMPAYNWVSLILVGLLVYGLGKQLFQYETILKAAGLSALVLVGLEILWCFGSGVRNLSMLWNGFTYSLMGCLAVGLLLVGAFWWEERKGYLTPLTIVKLSNLRHPLLQRLAIESPGTYHHSMVLAQMCEEAASAIGANSILARLGAMYHDIGKTKQPQYFIENNPEANDLHEKMSPSLSMLILLSHVKEGLALAEQYKLPYSVREFIATHHGTSVASFFYHKAKTNGAEVSESEFRYPGPLPRSKEASILMLADGCEAAVRSLTDKNESTIRSTVSSIISSRLEDGQLENSELTCRDLTIIEDVFVRVLLGLYHPRVPYPGGAET